MLGQTNFHWRLLLLSASFVVVSATGLTTESRGALDPFDTIANNRFHLDPLEEEHCENPQAFVPSRRLTTRDGRLIRILRQAAVAADPIESLTLSSYYFTLGDEELGRAFADLAVTGQNSFRRFEGLHQIEQINEKVLLRRLRERNWLSEYTDDQIAFNTSKSVNRAYKVAQVLPFGNSTERAELGYIAISGEDDQPYRPVNVPSGEFPQYDLKVQVQGKEVNTRFSIIESKKPLEPAPLSRSRTLPAKLEPEISKDAKIILYVHGMGSRLEEALDMAKVLRQLYREGGQNWTMISMDLPSSGYADKILHTQISSLSELGSPRSFPPGFNAQGRHRVPVLDFIEQFIVEFVNTLDRKLPVKANIQAVIGGSLGGNMTFRLGRRHDLPWLKNIVTWSPASIWNSLADGADIFKQLGVATAWNRAGGDTKNLVELPNKRKEYFQEAFGGAINIGFANIVPAQPDQWWRRNWACFDKSRQLAEIERHEVYNRNYRLWHWRLGGEQLIFSQQGAPDRRSPRYLENHTRMLLACGKNDDFNFTNICSSTEATAERMVNTPGRALFLSNTGHSIHAERPRFFTHEIVRFLSGH
jgi:pimeloyl-ACP methyl ester carboxylesterase